MGRLLRMLEGEKIDRDTIVVFTSDHGDMLSSHGKWDKQIWYDEAVNVPLVIRYPERIRAGLRPDTIVNVVDIAPTLLSLAGIRVPATMEGRDLSGAFAGKPAGEDTALIAGYMPFARQAFQYPEWRGVRSRTHTYVETRKGPLELYDNRSDPFQLENLANRGSHTAIQARLAGELKRWLTRTGDRFEERQAYWRRYNLDIGENGEVRYTNRAQGEIK